MKKVVSISGGKTSAYLAANYEADRLVFSLVRTSDPNCMFPDRGLAKMVEDRIGQEFVGTLEDDVIIHTIFDLEQYIGKKIDWVTGITFDEVIMTKGGWLPNKLHRYCTTWLKLDPIFYWWAKEFSREPVEMMIGYRANEGKRIESMMRELNSEGLSVYDATFEKHIDGGRYKGKNKWESVAWRKPVFPLYDDGIYKDDVEAFWEDKPVRFALRNNCVGCYHRNAMVIRKMYELHPEKIQWFADQEKKKGSFWKEDTSYQKIMENPLQMEFDFDNLPPCASGFCGV